MARLPLLSRRRTESPGAPASPAAPQPLPGRVPHRGVLRRERRALLRLRERRLRDLGGLMVEMYRRGIFREELLSESCADLVGIEERVAGIELLLSPRRAPERRCACGAPALPGARFCPNCGRPLGPQAGSAQTGSAQAGTSQAGTSQAGDETMIEAPEEESEP